MCSIKVILASFLLLQIGREINAQQLTFTLNTKGDRDTQIEDELLLLAVENGIAVFIHNGRSDRNSSWIKDSSTVKDAEGFPTFALVNKGTGQALKHADHNQPVGLVDYDKENHDNSVLWSESSDLGDGYRFIRRIDQVNLVFKEETGQNGARRLIMFNNTGSDYEKWRLDRSTEINVRVHTIGVGNTGQGLCLTIRNGVVVLATKNPTDRQQLWARDNYWGTTEKDSGGFPAFALVHLVTGQALKHANYNQPVGLLDYDIDHLDRSVLWTESEDVGGGYRFIRRIDQVNLVFDGEFGKVKNGSRLIIFNNRGADNQKWRID